MPSSNQAAGRPHWSVGRGFASADPERQGEVAGYVSHSDDEDSTVPARLASVRSTPQDWRRVQPDVESSSYEGSSSRRWR